MSEKERVKVLWCGQISLNLALVDKLNICHLPLYVICVTYVPLYLGKSVSQGGNNNDRLQV